VGDLAMFEDLAGRLHEAETKTRDAEKVWLKYVERVKNYSNTVIHHSRNNHLPTNTGFLQEKEQASLGDSKKPKSLDVFPLSTKPQLKPETTLEPEVLPKSLRVPLALEDYMATEKLGKEWVVRRHLCARQGKQFYTANTGDMTIHVQRVHQQLLPLISEAKGEETEETEPEENTPRNRSVTHATEE